VGSVKEEKGIDISEIMLYSAAIQKVKNSKKKKKKGRSSHLIMAE
jgi:hypothetical protein